MKTRMFQDLEAKDKNCHKELPSVLWALQTNINRSTRDMPFSLIYGVKAVLPPEIYLKSVRVAHFNPEVHTESRELDANLLEEKRSIALSNVHKYQAALRRYYNKSVVQRERAQYQGPSAEEEYPYQRQAQVFNSLRGIVHHSGCRGTRGLCVSRS
jgi:hypothetical protein